MAAAVTLSGCWDQVPLTDRAIVLAIVLDSRASGPDRLQWTFYFPNPNVTVTNLLAVKPSEQLYKVTVLAPNFASAYSNAEEHLARRLYLGHVGLLLLSTNVPTESVARFIEAYTRTGLTPNTAYVAVARSSDLGKLMKSTPEVVMPEIYWIKLFRCSTCQSENLTTHVWEAWDAFETPGTSPTIPYETDDRTTGRIAVYPRQGGPVVFDKQATMGWAYLTGRVVHEAYDLRVDGKVMAISQLVAHVTSHVSLSGHHLVVAAHVQAKAVIAETPLDQLVTHRLIHSFQRAVSRTILADCLAALNSASRSHTDPFAFARRYFVHAGYRAGHRPPPSWATLPLEVDVTVTTRIVGAGTAS
jgi:hypothetical protein